MALFIERPRPELLVTVVIIWIQRSELKTPIYSNMNRHSIQWPFHDKEISCLFLITRTRLIMRSLLHLRARSILPPYIVARVIQQGEPVYSDKQGLL